MDGVGKRMVDLAGLRSNAALGTYLGSPHCRYSLYFPELDRYQKKKSSLLSGPSLWHSISGRLQSQVPDSTTEAPFYPGDGFKYSQAAREKSLTPSFSERPCRFFHS